MLRTAIGKRCITPLSVLGGKHPGGPCVVNAQVWYGRTEGERVLWSDRETQQDCLGYSSYVTVLAEICTHKDLAPLTLGIFGFWGSGKTSLMQMLKSQLDASETRSKTLWFNAWRYEGREEAQSALIHAIIAKLVEDKTLLQDAADVLKRLKEGASVLKLAKFIGKTVMTMTPDINGFLSCFKEQSEKIAETMEQFDKDFEELLARAKIDRIVVFIDDLDRCSSEKVIETFETIKLFLNTPACTFVIGADAGKIEQAVGEVYKVADTERRRDYLEKIVQIPFNIPQQDFRDIACYVGMLIIGRHLGEKEWQKLVESRPGFYSCEEVLKAFCKWTSDNHILFGAKMEEIVAELKDVLPYVNSLARGLKGNPRQIKRFLNILSLRRQLAKANSSDVKPDLLVKLCVLEYAWKDFFNSLADTVDPESGQSTLLQEISKVLDTKGLPPADSRVLTDALSTAGLIEYLMLDPRLAGDIDLNPYLFLAQTSLSRGRAPVIVPADEKAKSLARMIESDDVLLAKAGGQQAAAQEPVVASSIVRILANDLPSAKEAVTKTRIIAGMEAICNKHKDQYPTAVKAVAQVDPAGNDALAIAGSTFLQKAKKAGIEVAEEQIDRFLKSSKFAEALSVKPRNQRPGR